MKKVLFILGELSDADVDWLLYVGRREELPATTVLIAEGKQIDALYILLTGSLLVTIEAFSGREIARLYSGEVVGEISFLDTRPPSATVTTLEKSVVLAIPRQQLHNKLTQDLGFAARFYRALAFFLSDRLRNTVSLLGYGEDRPNGPLPNGADDLNPHVVENLVKARARFETMLRRLKGH